MCHKKHNSMNRKGGDTQDDLREDGRTSFTLGVKERAFPVTI
jgi:hypothetical protein